MADNSFETINLADTGLLRGEVLPTSQDVTAEAAPDAPAPMPEIIRQGEGQPAKPEEMTDAERYAQEITALEEQAFENQQRDAKAEVKAQTEYKNRVENAADTVNAQRASTMGSFAITSDNMSALQRAYRSVNPNQPEPEIFSQYFSTGNMEEDNATKAIVADAKGYLTPHPIGPDGRRDTSKYLPGAIDNDGNFVLANFHRILFETTDRRYAELVENGGMFVLSKYVEGSKATKISLDNTNPNSLPLAVTTLPPALDYLKLSGKTYNQETNTWQGPAPQGWLMDLKDFVFTTDDEKSVGKYRNLMRRVGILNPYDQRVLMQQHNSDLREAVGTLESVADLGLFYANLAFETALIPIKAGVPEEIKKSGYLGVTSRVITDQATAARKGEPDPYRDITYATLSQEEREKAIFADAAATAVLAIGAEETIKAEAESDPTINVIVGLDGERKIQLTTDGFEFKYYAEVVADRMGISVEGAEKLLSFRQDMFERTVRFVPDVIGFGAPAYGVRLASSVNLFKNYSKYLTEKYGTTTVQGAVREAARRGDDLVKIREDWARTQLLFPSLPLLRNMRTQNIAEKVDIGFGTTPKGQAIARATRQSEFSQLQARINRNLDVMANPNASVLDKARAAKNFVNNQKDAAVLRHVNSRMSRAAISAVGEEFSVAVGMGAAGQTVQSIFGEDHTVAAEFFGAFVGDSLIRKSLSATAGLIGATAEFVSAPVTSLIGIPNFVREVRDRNSLMAALSTRPAAQRNMMLQMLEAAGPEAEKVLLSNLEAMRNLEQQSLQILDIDGNPIFKEGDMPVLLMNIIGIDIAEQLADQMTNKIVGMDIPQGTAAMTEVLNFRRMQQGYHNQLKQAIARLSPNVEQIAKTNPELASIITRADEYLNSKTQVLDDNLKRAEEALSSLAEQQRMLFEYGVTVDGIPVVSATDIVSQSNRKILQDNVDDSGKIVNYEKYLSQLEAEAKRLQGNYLEISQMHSGIGTINSGTNVGIRLAGDAAGNKEMDRSIRDANYDAVKAPYADLPESEAPMMDATAFFTELRRNNGLSFMDNPDYTSTLDETLDLNVRNGLGLGIGGKKPESRVGLKFANIPALRSISNTPLGNIFGITADMNLGVQADKLNQVVRGIQNTLIEAGSNSDFATMKVGSSPIENWFFIRDLMSSNDPAVLAALSPDMTPEIASTIASNMKLGLSIDEYKGVRSALSVSDRVAQTPSGVAAIRARTDLNTIALSDDLGFSTGFYGTEPTSVVADIKDTLGRADKFNTEYQQRWFDRNTKTYNLSRLSKSKQATAMDDLVNSTMDKVQKGRTENIEAAVDSELGSELARLLGGTYDPDQKRFFLIEGTPQAELAKSLIIQYSNNLWWTSESGEQIRNAAKSGKISITAEIDPERAQALAIHYGKEALVHGSIDSQTLLLRLQALEQIPVYKADPNTKALLKVDGEPQTTYLFEDGELFRFSNPEQYTDGIPADQQIYSIREGLRNATDNLNKAYDEVKRDVAQYSTAEREALKPLRDLTQRLQRNNMSSSTLLIDHITSGNLNDIISLRSAYVTRTLSVDPSMTQEAAETIFNRQMAHLLSFEVLQRVSTNGVPDPEKLGAALNDPTIVRALDEFAPGARQNYETILDIYSGFRRPDSKNKISIRKVPTEITLETEFSKLNSVWIGKLGLKQYGFQFAIRQARQNQLLAFRALMTDPEFGRMLIDVLEKGEGLTLKQAKNIELRLYTVMARDLYLTQQSGREGIVSSTINSGRAILSTVSNGVYNLMVTGPDGKQKPLTAPGGSMQEQLKQLGVQ